MSKRTQCRHFNGILNKVCKVGVNYQEVARPDSHPIDLPCFSDQGCTGRCAKVSYYTEQELAEQDAEVGRILQDYLGKIDRQICPHCNQPYTSEQQVGRCVYALPCYHRLYQGTAKAKEKKLHPYFQEQLDRKNNERTGDEP